MAGTDNADGRAIDVLLVEPNPGDARLFTESFSEAHIANAVHVVHDGEAALDFVHKRGDHADSPRPDLILLDLQLPSVSGEEVVAELKGDPELRRIPVLVLTSSDAEEDVARSYDLNVNAYVQKPVDPDEFVELARSIEGFWLSVVTLPPKERVEPGTGNGNENGNGNG